MIDWQGNKVKAGDIVVLVSIRPPSAPDRVVVFNPATGEMRDAYCMILEGIGRPFSRFYESNVTEIDGILQMDTPHPGGGVIICPVNFVYDEQKDNPNVVICIKGKTDSPEEFFKNYYKPHMN